MSHWYSFFSNEKIKTEAIQIIDSYHTCYTNIDFFGLSMLACRYYLVITIYVFYFKRYDQSKQNHKIYDIGYFSGPNGMEYFFNSL